MWSKILKAILLIISGIIIITLALEYKHQRDQNIERINNLAVFHAASILNALELAHKKECDKAAIQANLTYWAFNVEVEGLDIPNQPREVVDFWTEAAFYIDYQISQIKQQCQSVEVFEHPVIPDEEEGTVL